MHKRYLVAFIVGIFLASLLSSSVKAISQSIVISQAQIGNSSTSRLVELYNTSEDPIDVTDWCLYHSSASGKTKQKLLCFTGDSLETHLIFGGLSYALVGSNELGIDSDFNLGSGLGTASGGHIYILDNDKLELDRLGWGAAVESETTAFAFDMINTERVIERKISPLGTYIDTDDNSLDFINSALRDTYLIGAITEVDDICPNIDEIQPLVPTGYYRDEAGLCQLEIVDMCSNVDGLQPDISLGYEVDESGGCIRLDVCLNFDGVQKIVPSGFTELEGNCVVDGLPLQISEMMPNSPGNDNGHEFVEIYNPNDTEVSLGFYKFLTGVDQIKSYDFPPDSTIAPKSYVVFYNDQISFTLVNTSGEVGLVLADGVKLGASDVYSQPRDGVSWAKIDNVWQYTNRPTPGRANLTSIIEPILPSVAAKPALKPCLTNQYRSLETNRCRNKPAARTFVACDEGQYRNPKTNRCKSVLGAHTKSLTPCDSGQVRNPATNRCKTVVKMAAAPYPVQTTKTDSSEGYMGWWIAGSLGVLAIGYAAWEWHSEIARFFSWFVGRLGLSK